MSGEDAVKTNFEDLLRRVETTKEIRYANLHRFNRYLGNDQIVLNVLSLMIILASLISLVFAESISPMENKAVGVFTAAISVYIIILNYEMTKKRMEYKAAILEISAGLLNNLYISMRSVRNVSDAEFDVFFKKYRVHLMRFDLTHENDDRDYVLAEKAHLRSDDWRHGVTESEQLKVDWRKKGRTRITYQMIIPVIAMIIAVVFLLRGVVIVPVLLALAHLCGAA